MASCVVGVSPLRFPLACMMGHPKGLVAGEITKEESDERLAHSEETILKVVRLGQIRISMPPCACHNPRGRAFRGTRNPLY